MSRSSAARSIVGGLGFAAKTFLPIAQRADDAPFLLDHARQAASRSRSARSCGFVVGLTSVGSGTFFGLAMLLVFPLTAQKIVGTDMLPRRGAALGRRRRPPAPRQRRPARDGWLLVGSIPGVLIGSHLSIRVPERALRVAFAFVLVLSGIKLVEGRRRRPRSSRSASSLGALAAVAWGGRCS